jgi:hypothetical protein
MKIIYFEANSCFISQTCEKRVFGQCQDLSHFPCVLPVTHKALSTFQVLPRSFTAFAYHWISNANPKPTGRE